MTGLIAMWNYRSNRDKFPEWWLLVIMWFVWGWCLLDVPAGCADERVGSIHGRVVFQDDPPKVGGLVVGSDRGISGVAIYLFSSVEAMKANADRNGLKGSHLIKISNGLLTPKILGVRTNDIVVFENASPNAVVIGGTQVTHQMLIPPRQKVSLTLQQQTNWPLIFRTVVGGDDFCSIVVRDHLFMSLSDSSGRFELPGVPEGHHSIRVWHPELLVTKAVSRSALVHVDVRPGEISDVGVLRFSESHYLPYQQIRK